MKHFAEILGTVLAAGVLLSAAAYAAPTILNAASSGLPTVSPDDPLPELTAHSAIIMEASTGQILYSRNIDERRYPASTTKMMTLIVALEKGNPDDVVTVSKYAAGTDGSTLWLEQGDRIPLNDLLYGLIMMSGNDAAVAIAEHIAGTETRFAAMMTDKAGEIGAKDTNFVNPHGLPDDKHYTTARDLARIAAYGYKNPRFAEIVSRKEMTLPWIKDPAHFWRNENQILWLYEGANGIKTGYTDLAGRCLAAGAKRDGVQLVTVVLDSLYMWNDTIALLDYGFKHITRKKIVADDEKIETLPVVSGWKKSVVIRAKNEVEVPLFDNQSADKFRREVELPAFLEAPLKEGETVGKLRIMYDDKEVAAVDLIADRAVERKSFFLSLYKFLKGLWKDGGAAAKDYRPSRNCVQT